MNRERLKDNGINRKDASVDESRRRMVKFFGDFYTADGKVTGCSSKGIVSSTLTPSLGFCRTRLSEQLYG